MRIVTPGGSLNKTNFNKKWCIFNKYIQNSVYSWAILLFFRKSFQKPFICSFPVTLWNYVYTHNYEESVEGVITCGGALQANKFTPETQT